MKKFKWQAKIKNDFLKGTADGDAQGENIDTVRQDLLEWLPRDLHVEPEDIIQLDIREV